MSLKKKFSASGVQSSTPSNNNAYTLSQTSNIGSTKGSASAFGSRKNSKEQ